MTPPMAASATPVTASGSHGAGAPSLVGDSRVVASTNTGGGGSVGPAPTAPTDGVLGDGVPGVGDADGDDDEVLLGDPVLPEVVGAPLFPFPPLLAGASAVVAPRLGEVRGAVGSWLFPLPAGVSAVAGVVAGPAAREDPRDCGSGRVLWVGRWSLDAVRVLVIRERHVTSEHFVTYQITLTPGLREGSFDGGGCVNFRLEE